MRVATLLISIFYLGLAACQSIPTRTSDENASTSIDKRDRAPEISDALSDTEFLIETAEYFFQNSEFKKSLGVLLRLKSTPTEQPLHTVLINTTLTPSNTYRAKSLLLRLSLKGHYKLDSKDFLSTLKPSNNEQRRDTLILTAEVFERELDFSNAAKALLSISSVPKAHEKNLSAAIWRSLSNLSPPELVQMKNNTTDPSQQAWFTLAEAYKTALSPYQIKQIWANWKTKYPDHLGNRYPPYDLHHIPKQPKNIALMIPLTGPLAPAGISIRDGFISAYLSQYSRPSSNTNEQQVRIYDTSKSGIKNIVNQALKEGANALVGPLDKRKVSQLLSMKNSKPTVVLNRADALPISKRDAANSDSNNVYKISHSFQILQLSLSIEDDVRAISKRIISENNRRVAVFYGAADWCSRAANIFERFAGSSIKIVNQTPLVDLIDITDSVGSAFLVDRSLDRNRYIKRTIGIETEFNPRRRQDIDAVVAFMETAEFQTLAAALSFHFAQDLPIFTTSSAVAITSGLQRKTAVNYTEMPWNLYHSNLKKQINATFDQTSNPQSLYALGVDAFRIVNQTGSQLLNSSIDGSTGKLIIRNDGVIIREPAWGKLIE
ncbi:MAG: penicillin-binding protein activator [Pseudomonadales bacterium]|nr:penicillin-binding protein activator [Pseudomonadales bacterium]